MNKRKYVIWEKEEYHYPKAGAFIPFIMASTHEDGEVHPAMIVVPGGAYAALSPFEADFQARKFFERGYNTFVLCYTNNVTLDTPIKKQPLCDISRTVQFIRKNHVAFGTDIEQVYASGYSAGAHLVASLAVHHEESFLHPADVYQEISNRLDAAIVHYPIVTKESGRNIYEMVMGKAASEEELDFMSLEKHVTKNSSPMFLIHGTMDSVCPVQNTLALAEACAKQGIDYEVHLIQNGEHGVTNEDTTTEEAFASLYVLDQLYETIQAMSGEEFKSYHELFGELSKDLDYEAMLQEILSSVMRRIFEKALNPNPEETHVAADMKKKKLASTVNDWRDMVDAWLELVRENREEKRRNKS